MPGRKSACIFVYVLFATLVFTGCKENKKDTGKRNDAAAIVDVIIATPQSLIQTVEANGTIVANEFAELRPEINGRLTYLNVQEGKPVAQGTVLARINDADLLAQMEKSKVQLGLAQQTEQRLKKLLDVNGINQSDYDAAVNQVNNLKADMDYTQALIDKTVVKAPFSGVIGLRRVSPGQYVTSNDIIASIQQLNKMKVDFTIPEQYKNVIHIGNMVNVELDASNNIIKKARIVAVEPQINQDTRNLIVRAVLENGSANPGAFVKVYVDAGENKKAIMVPTNSIIPEDRNNQLIIVKNGKATFVDVQTGYRQADNVEITKGVNAGDTVIVTGVLFARPKSEVIIRSVKTLDQLSKP
ncbi:MAG: efflux RND transporter periplasmic adaptor subunit [Bacteroidetes bacterium]|nr:efflux RND transporter periplasmic adaptor subunit [Bacteroidota bacterium]MBS1930319.1 efflux RND transporter periplasmic adaptor subunit [Bacteroidota bacterium]